MAMMKCSDLQSDLFVSAEVQDRLLGRQDNRTGECSDCHLLVCCKQEVGDGGGSLQQNDGCSFQCVPMAAM